jgi:ribonucleoside-diphosphate reductase alpha chain
VVNGKNGEEEKYIVYHPLVLEYEKATGKSYKSNRAFITSEKIDWKNRVDLQAILQTGISESISSTINLPKNTTKETVSDIYMYAWKKRLKGITIYRDGCREGVLNDVKKTENFDVVENYKFPDETSAIMKVLRSEGKKWYVTYTIDNETKLPNSLFVNTNSSETTIITNNVIEHIEELAKKYIKNDFIEELKNKSNHQSNVVKIARFLSLLLRHRIPIIDIIETLTNANLPVTSFAFRIKKLLSEFIEGKYTGEKCSECGNQIVYQNGCTICLNCGNSKCG